MITQNDKKAPNVIFHVKRSMTEARRKARIAMLQRGITYAELATETGLGESTIQSLLSQVNIIGRRRRSRQAITTTLHSQLWDDIPVTERFFTLPPGTEFEFPKAKLARDAFDELTRELTPGAVTRRGRVVTFSKPVMIAIEIEKPKRSARV